MEDSSAVRTGLVPALPLSERSAEKPRPRGAAGESCPQKARSLPSMEDSSAVRTGLEPATPSVTG